MPNWRGFEHFGFSATLAVSKTAPVGGELPSRVAEARLTSCLPGVNDCCTMPEGVHSMKVGNPTCRRDNFLAPGCCGSAAVVAHTAEVWRAGLFDVLGWIPDPP